MKKVVLTLCLFTLVAGGAVFAQSRSARPVRRSYERSESEGGSEKKLTRSEKKALEKAKKQQAKEEKKQKAELEKARKEQEKAVRDKERARAKEQRRLERKANKRSMDDEEEFGKRSKKQEKPKKQVKKQEKKSSWFSRSRTRSEEKPVKKVKVRSEKPRKVVRSEEEGRSRRSARSAQARKLEREQRLARERQEKAERKQRATLKHEEHKQERTQRLIDLRTKDVRKKEEHRREHERRTELERQLVLKERKRVTDQAERLAFARQDRAEKMNRWKELHQLETNRDYDAGRYADLYKLPAWPVASWFFENKDLLNVNVSYKYATDAYADDRRRFDVTGIEFGYQPIQLQDISLAAKLSHDDKIVYKGSPVLSAAADAAAAAVGGALVALLTAATTAASTAASTLNTREAFYDNAFISAMAARLAVVAPAVAVAAAAFGAAAVDSNWFKPLATQVVSFNGKTEEYGTSIDFARYVMSKNVVLGVQVPVLYRHNKLESNFAYIQDVLTAKGIREMGGSATGLGDVALFANVQTGARTFEKVLGGLKVTFPTGKQGTTAKLWAPELGTGHTQFSAYASMLMDYNRLLNPHVYVEGTYSMAAHENHRVPVKVSGSVTKGGGVNNLAAASINKLGETTALALTPAAGANAVANLSDTFFAMGSRFKISGADVDQNLGADVVRAVPNNQTATLFSEFDTSIKGMGDKVLNLRMLRGMEFKVRVGNMIEQFLVRRGTLDLFYDLNVKFKDSAHGYNTQDYNLDILSDRTNLMAHKIGAQFDYQFDPYARWRVGAMYTFAGINAPKTFEISSALGYSF